MAKTLFKQLADVIKDQKINVKNAFESFDKDGDGKIDAKELYKCLKAMGQNYSMEEVNYIMLAVDENKVNIYYI